MACWVAGATRRRCSTPSGRPESIVIFDAYATAVRSSRSTRADTKVAACPTSNRPHATFQRRRPGHWNARRARSRQELLRTSWARPTRAGKRQWRPWRLHLRRRGTVDHARLQRAVHRFHVPPAHVSEVAAFSDLDAGADFFVRWCLLPCRIGALKAQNLTAARPTEPHSVQSSNRNLVEHCLSNRIAIFIPARPAVARDDAAAFRRMAFASPSRSHRAWPAAPHPAPLQDDSGRLLHGSTREGPEGEELLHRLPRHFRCQSGSGLARCKRPAERIS